jgi:dipeptidyl aminopeptidase/acylaminoacyl peptidase
MIYLSTVIKYTYMKSKLLLPLILLAASAIAQDHMTPEMLWSLKRVSPVKLSNDNNYLLYSAKQIDWTTEKSTTEQHVINIATGKQNDKRKDAIAKEVREPYPLFATLGKNVTHVPKDKDAKKETGDADNVQQSPDGKYVAYSKDVLVKPMLGTDIYKDLPKTTAQVYTDLNYRHWDTWEDGKYSHVFIMSNENGYVKDIMAGEAFDCPQKPFGGAEDFVWSPDSKGLVYVCKKKFGKEYAQSTNTDLYYYDIKSGNTTNWTINMMGYDTQPAFSPDGKYLAWTSMAREGFEADKVNLYVMNVKDGSFLKTNLTDDWDGTVENFAWDADASKIYFNAPWRGTAQLFEVKVKPGKTSAVRQITDGKFDVTGIVGQRGKELIVTRCDMNRATEIYAANIETGAMRQLTHENDAAYNAIKLSNTELRMMPSSDGGKMGVWVIYPPNFDPNKKYPTLLYCQGGPQSALSQFYSFRWNFQLMAAQGYIVVAPNRHGMPGWGAKWNEEISKDWGGQPMRDYLTAIDELSKERYVDKNRLGCIGASYGGYSVYMLAGMHNNRFKTFIAHDGLFDLKSWYGTTEELWFANWDIGGSYWQKPTPEGYAKFNPSNFVDKWNTPIMIVQGGMDYRVPIEQGLEAFQAAQLRGVKSKLLYLPNENHWVLHAQNGLAWQREFFKWLDETLK